MIGRIKKVPLRNIWRNEAKDFSTWLYKNLDALSEQLRIGMTPVEKEKGVGSFSADILAEDTSGGRIIIENQLDKTDHDHLGKIITYVSNLEAKTVVWISSNPRPEHERAIDWLNELATDVGFYLVKVKAVSIGNSAPAPVFDVIVGPTKKSKIVGRKKKELAETHRKRKEFWRLLLEKSTKKTLLHSNISPSTSCWIAAGAGKSGLSYNYVVLYKYGAVELYINRRAKKENKRIFDYLHAHKKKIEKIFGDNLEWQRLDERRASRIIKKYTYYGLDDKKNWNRLQNAMISGMIKLGRALSKYLEDLPV